MFRRARPGQPARRREGGRPGDAVAEGATSRRRVVSRCGSPPRRPGGEGRRSRTWRRARTRERCPRRRRRRRPPRRRPRPARTWWPRRATSVVAPPPRATKVTPTLARRACSTPPARTDPAGEAREDEEGAQQPRSSCAMTERSRSQKRLEEGTAFAQGRRHEDEVRGRAVEDDDEQGHAACVASSCWPPYSTGSTRASCSCHVPVRERRARPLRKRFGVGSGRGHSRLAVRFHESLGFWPAARPSLPVKIRKAETSSDGGRIEVEAVLEGALHEQILQRTPSS